MKLFKNRTVLGIFCIAVSLIICFARVDRFQCVLLRDYSGDDQGQCAHTSGDAQLNANLLLEDHGQQGQHQDHQG